MVDAAAHIADPRHADVPMEALAGRSARTAGMDGATAPQARAFGRSDTVYLAVIDRHGNGVSFINSVYDDFGSGHVAKGLGFAMQNRGAGFSLDPAHPNCIAPRKRPFHTIIPALIQDGDALHTLFGVSGGYMQPQGHVQLVASLLDYGNRRAERHRPSALLVGGRTPRHRGGRPAGRRLRRR